MTVYAKIPVFVALLLIVAGERVFACSCAHEEVDKAVLRADYILVGTILSRQDTPPNSHGISSDADPAYFEVAVERMLKGEQRSRAIVVTKRMSESCGYPFEQDTRYLIFGYRVKETPAQTQQKDMIRTNLCTLTTAENVDSLATQVEAVQGPEEKICGGIAGIECPQGYQCEYPEPNFPDAQGVCKKIDYCNDPKAYADWSRYFQSAPENDTVIQLFALRIGLCQMVDARMISLERAVYILEQEKRVKAAPKEQ